MKLANIQGRAALIVADGISDVETASAGRFGPLFAITTLLPGDIIFTGTPSGVVFVRQPPRYLQPGQILESWIEGIGTLRNRCRSYFEAATTDRRLTGPS